MLPARSNRERKLASRAVDARQTPPIGEMKRAVLFAVVHHLDFDGEKPVQVLDVQHEVSQDRAALKHERGLRPHELDDRAAELFIVNDVDLAPILHDLAFCVAWRARALARQGGARAHIARVSSRTFLRAHDGVQVLVLQIDVIGRQERGYLRGGEGPQLLPRGGSRCTYSELHVSRGAVVYDRGAGTTAPSPAAVSRGLRINHAD